MRMRKKKSRKVYALVNPLMYAMEGAALIDERTLDRLRGLELSAIEAFRIGAATVNDWQAIADLCNLAQSMAEDGIGPEALDAAKRCEQALIEVHDRYRRTAKLGVTAQGLTAMREVYEYHDLQRQAVSRSVYERHIDRVWNKIRSGSPDVIVVTRREK